MWNHSSDCIRGYLLIALAVLTNFVSVRPVSAQAAKFAAPASSGAEIATYLTGNSRLDAGASPNARGQKRPIQDFIKAQGTTATFYQTPYTPGLPDYAVGFTTASCPGEFCQYATGSRIAVVDYVGLAAKYLAKHGYHLPDVKTDGFITERLLPDGRAEVTVVLHTTDALTFISAWNPSAPSPPQSAETNLRLFASSVSDLLRYPTSRAALGDSELLMKFKRAPNQPMPDLVKLFAFGAYPDLELTLFYFSAAAKGYLPGNNPANGAVLQHYVNPPPLLINGVLTKPLLLDGGWISELVDITPAN
jgi:hypothetical protein